MQEEEYTQKYEENNRRQMNELKTLSQIAERDRNEASKWRKKYEFLDEKHKKQGIYYKEQINKLHRELEVENQASLMNGGTKVLKARMQKLEE